MSDAPVFPEPKAETADPAVLFARYLDWCRGTVVAKVESLPDEEQRSSRLVSGWTPVELLSHLAHMEQRWFVWGFLGEQVAVPWGDRVDGQWHVPDGTTVADLVVLLRSTGERTSAVLASTPLDQLAAAGGRFAEDGEEPPTLAWICFHVFQEYARHMGHLDIAVELAGGPLGE